ncbi:MAG: alpha/beta fold hydrolase [Oscillospiraceae bacterium]|nr:alpha/beta fold hydrolase [Oscillospiraceae bacterium]
MTETKDFSFRSRNRTNTIHCRICKPSGEAKGIVQIAHGITEHIGMYDSFMSYLAGKGYIAVGNDHLGHGLSAADEQDKGFFSEERGWHYCAADINKLSTLMKAKYPGLPYYYYGFSMGSYLVRTCLIKYPGCCDKALIVGTGFPAPSRLQAGYALTDTIVRRKGSRYVSRRVSKLIFSSYNSHIEDQRTPYDWLSRVDSSVDDYMNDPLRTGASTVSLYRDMFGGIIFDCDKNNLEKMNKDMPVLFLSGSEDPVGDYGDGVYRTYKSFLNAGMKNVTLKIYGGARHQLLKEQNKDEVYDDILAFLK